MSGCRKLVSLDLSCTSVWVLVCLYPGLCAEPLQTGMSTVRHIWSYTCIYICTHIHEYPYRYIHTLYIYRNCRLQKEKECLGNSEKETPAYLIMETKSALQYLFIHCCLGGCADLQVLCSCWIPPSVVFIKEVNVDLKKLLWCARHHRTAASFIAERVHYLSLSGNCTDSP